MAMKYQQLVEKSKSAAKQVQGLPPRVERPGVTQKNLDAKAEAMNRLSRTGSITDAAAAMEAIFASR